MAQRVFKVGDYVESTWNGSGKVFDCLIEKDNGDGTFGLLFNDGDFRKKALPEWFTYDDFNNQSPGLIEKDKCYWTCPDKTCAVENHKWRKKCHKCQVDNPTRIVSTGGWGNFGGFGNFGGGFKFDPKAYFERTVERAEQDAQAYLQGYPGQQDKEHMDKNLRFYSGEIKMQPDNFTIDEFHQHWWGNYEDLESGHSFVQWIFPIREQGLNHMAAPLQKWEADAIAADPKLQGRIIKSYRLMLDFYGMVLKDEKTGEIGRNEKNYEYQYDNLERCSHNYLRITRILKCLGEVGLSHYQAPFMRHVFNEIYNKDQLECCEQAARLYWVNVVRDPKERQELKDFAAKFREIPMDAKRKPWGGPKKIDHKWDQLEGSGIKADLSLCKFSKDQAVEAKWKSKPTFYNATVRNVNLDGTYRVEYSDNDWDNFVPESNIRVPGASSSDQAQDKQPEETAKPARPILL